jgi:hypothetical protein
VASSKEQDSGSAASGVAAWLNKLQKCCGSEKPFTIPEDPKAHRLLAEMGIPKDTLLTAKFDISLFKPQVVLRSDVPDHEGVVGDSVCLVAAERIAIKSYDVNDQGTEHRASEPILSR